MAIVFRGIRNNNPANIRRSSENWLGQKQLQLDRNFCQFTDIKYGIRAFFILCRTYRYKYGIKTCGVFLDRFAPKSENNHVAYWRYLNSKGIVKDMYLATDMSYIIFAKYIFRFESDFVVSSEYLKGVMDEMNCHVIISRKECNETSLF